MVERRGRVGITPQDISAAATLSLQDGVRAFLCPRPFVLSTFKCQANFKVIFCLRGVNKLRRRTHLDESRARLWGVQNSAHTSLCMLDLEIKRTVASQMRDPKVCAQMLPPLLM